MYVNNSPDEIRLNYVPLENYDERDTLSFWTTGKRSVGELMDFLTPSATIKDVDSLGNGNYKVNVSFESKSGMMSFLAMFAPEQLYEREQYLKKYEKQKKESVL